MESNSLSLFDRFNKWLKESIMIKLMSIGFLLLILLIPSSWIGSLIAERQARSGEVISEITDKWSGTQTVTGPVLVIPFTKVETVSRWEKGDRIQEVVKSVHKAYFLPEKLSVTGDVAPEVRHRGIYEAVVYTSKLGFTAEFATPDFSRWEITDDLVHWKDAALVMGIADQRGINEDPLIASGEKKYFPEPAGDIGVILYRENEYNAAGVAVPQQGESGISANLGWLARSDVRSSFTMNLQLKGSDGIYFVPAGKSTEINLNSSWVSPSFEGRMLPDSHQISDQGFNATWKVLSYNRPFSQQWRDQEQVLGGSHLGVRLLIPADEYQKSTRTSKYDVLIIILAFTSLFLVEITAKLRIHPFQYILVGAALTIYYTLLLSLSEHLGYNLAYLISSLATVVLLTMYSFTFLRSKALVALFSGLMSLFYVFIFVIIQAEDFSLLLGSIGLFLIIAVIMYFSRNIRWYGDTELKSGS
jgi:inner membrane protein